MKLNNMTTRNDIEKLLRRFMDGLTTVDEEARLAEWFRTNDVPEEWIDYKQMFAFFDAGMPDCGPVPAEEKPKKRRWILPAMLSAAASVLLLLGISLTMDEPQPAGETPIVEVSQYIYVPTVAEEVQIVEETPQIAQVVKKAKPRPKPIAEEAELSIDIREIPDSIMLLLVEEKMREQEAIQEMMLRQAEEDFFAMGEILEQQAEESGMLLSDNR